MVHFLRRGAVCARYGIAASTLYLWISKGQFPRPVRLGLRVVAWRVVDLEEWEKSR